MTKIAERHARDVMTREPACLAPDDTIRAFAEALEEFEVSGFPVVDPGGTLVGVVSTTDLMRRCLLGAREEAPGHFFSAIAEQLGEDVDLETEEMVQVADIMSTDVVTARPDDAIGTIARKMTSSHVHRVIVVDEANVPIGIITSLDLIRALGG